MWAAWDQPALGALQAIEAAGRQGEGIVITGIDANPQAREEIAEGGNFEATVAQDFAGIGTAAADAVAAPLAGESDKPSRHLRADQARDRGQAAELNSESAERAPDLDGMPRLGAPSQAWGASPLTLPR